MKNVSYFCPYEATQQLFMINRLKLKPLFTLKSKNFDQSKTRIHRQTALFGRIISLFMSYILHIGLVWSSKAKVGEA